MNADNPESTLRLPPRSPDPTGVRDHFEAAWKQTATTSPGPRIEDFLGGVTDAQRLPLLHELIALDLNYRRGCGERPQIEEYRGRFSDVTEDALGRLLGAPSDRTEEDAAVQLRCPHCHNRRRWSRRQRGRGQTVDSGALGRVGP